MSTNPTGMKKKDELQRSWRDEVGKLRRPATVFALACTCSLLTIAACVWLVTDKLALLDHAAQARAAAILRVRAADIETTDIATYQPRYLQLKEAGLVGEERRLAWTESIRQIQAQRQLLPVTFEFEPQQAVTMSAAVPIGEYRLQASRMQLHMDLLHEMDLFDFLADLRTRSFYTVEQCKIKRSAAPIDSIKAARLNADCTLDWVTLGSLAPVALPVAPAK